MMLTDICVTLEEFLAGVWHGQKVTNIAAPTLTYFFVAAAASRTRVWVIANCLKEERGKLPRPFQEVEELERSLVKHATTLASAQ